MGFSSHGAKTNSSGSSKDRVTTSALGRDPSVPDKIDNGVAGGGGDGLFPKETIKTYPSNWTPNWVMVKEWKDGLTEVFATRKGEPGIQKSHAVISPENQLAYCRAHGPNGAKGKVLFNDGIIGPKKR